MSTSRRIGSRGFTLIELLVAIIAGLLVAAAAVSFSRQATRFFSQEARIASAQMSVLAGFQRLQADVSRAAYMSTTDMVRDYAAQRVCAPNYDAWPGPVKNLTSLTIKSGEPDVIRIAGNLASSEMFAVLTVAEEGGGGHTVYLQANNGPMTRAGFSPDGGVFETVFKQGRLLRIVDQQGNMEFEVIASSEYTSVPTIKTVGPLPLKGELTMAGEGAEAVSSAPCGIAGFGIGVLANPVSLVEYRIGSLKGVSPYAETIYDEAYQVPGSDEPDIRTELVRSELLFDRPVPAAGEEAEWTEEEAPEIVAEFAVDLKVGLWITDSGTGKLAYIPPGKPAEDQTEPSDLPGTPATGPSAIRAVDLRLVVRSREADRETDTDTTDLPDGFMLRYPMTNGRYARARTLTANVALMNHRGDAW